MRITYSKDVDMLYVSLTTPTGRVASVENENGDLLRIDTMSGKIIGVNIQLFLHRVGNGEKIEVPEIGFSLGNMINVSELENIHVKTH
jgi:uncharacterized protein YuzE